MNIEDVWSDWQVEKIIGRGSYGTVYKCFKDTENSKEYSAIKVISVPQDNYEINSFDSNGMTNEQTKDYYKDIVDEFIGEIKILESLKNNKNIVNIYDSKVVEKEDGIGWQIFIRMELLTDFNSYTATREMKTEDILKLGTDLCEALKVCNDKKIIHRDIKPENIFVDNEGNFKLGDFGVAKQLEKTEMSLSRKGTYNYMAPEVFNSKKYDSRADIYSLGLVMYRLFNRNRLPFLDPNKQIIKYSEREEAFEKRIRGEKIPPISGIDENINGLLLRACAYKQDDRYRTVEDFLQSIENILLGKKSNNQIKNFIIKHKLIFIIVSLLLLAFLSGLAGYFWSERNYSIEQKTTVFDNSISDEATDNTEKS